MSHILYIPIVLLSFLTHVTHAQFRDVMRVARCCPRFTKLSTNDQITILGGGQSGEVGCGGWGVGTFNTLLISLDAISCCYLLTFS